MKDKYLKGRDVGMINEGIGREGRYKTMAEKGKRERDRQRERGGWGLRGRRDETERREAERLNEKRRRERGETKR